MLLNEEVKKNRVLLEPEDVKEDLPLVTPELNPSWGNSDRR